jgi:hypothetical protein
MSPHDLLKINVNDHTEKKNNLTYLSWAWAWAEALKADPQANYEVLMFSDPDHQTNMLPFQDLGGSHMVWVKVTMFGKTITQQLPILDYRNKCIAQPNAFEVNTSIMRCLTKGIAMHGLGLYIYAGEDLPEGDAPANMGELFKKEDDAAYAKTLAKIAPKTTMGELTRKEDAPKYEKIIAKTAPKVKAQPTEWDPSDESRKFFTESMIEWTTHCTSVAGLNSYWKSNELQLDSLKETHPSLYKEVLDRFKTLKLQLTEETK